MKSTSIITTQEEIDGYNIIRAILRQYIAIDKIFMRDMKSCCLVLYEDNQRKPLARLYFNNLSQLSIGLINANKNEDKVPIAKIDDIFKYSDRLIATAKYYESMAVMA